MFSLHINNNTDCYSSLREFGIAEALGKTLLIYIDENTYGYDDHNTQLYDILREEQPHTKDHYIKRISKKYLLKNIKQFHMFKHMVIESLNKLTESKRNLYIKCHPKIPCDSYEEYVDYLNDNL